MRLLGIDAREVQCARRGFATSPDDVRLHLENVGHAFLDGYHAALRTTRVDDLPPQLDCVEAKRRGFAFEGAAMPLALLDTLLPRRPSRIDLFLRGPADGHVYMARVGIGWALARLRRRVARTLARRDGVLGWLVVDGYGFHEGYSHWRRPRDCRHRVVRVGTSGERSTRASAAACGSSAA